MAKTTDRIVVEVKAPVVNPTPWLVGSAQPVVMDCGHITYLDGHVKVGTRIVCFECKQGKV